MGFSRAVPIAAVLACCVAPAAEGRLFSVPSYKELLDKADLVVIATPVTTTADTEEHTQLEGVVKVVGVETTFKVEAVLKGDRSVEQFVLHHYRETSDVIKDGLCLVFFEASDKESRGTRRLLFLVRESDGRYAPAGGQSDPAFGSVSILLDALNYLTRPH